MSKVHLINANSMYIPLEDESVHMVVTSPPYFALRQYKTGDDPNEIGIESLHDCKGWATGDFCCNCYTCRTLAWTSEVKRVLRKDGVFFLNLGDKYNGSGGSGGDYNNGGLRDGQPGYGRLSIDSLKDKDLVGVPWMIAFAMREAQGWWLRNEIIWWKRNAYPEGGAHDRFGRDHETIFMFSKSEKYFFDKFASFVPYDKPINRWGGNTLVADGISEWSNETGQELYREREQRPNPEGKGRRTTWDIPEDEFKQFLQWKAEYANERNTTWDVPTSGVGGSHFAKYPTDLVKICIEVGTSEYGCCSNCGAPYERIVERTFTGEYNDKEASKQRERMEGVISGGKDRVTLGRTDNVHNKTIGWQPTCDCCQMCERNEKHEIGEYEDYPVEPCTVLDPFVGSGTTLLAAKELNRNGIGLDLSFHYLSHDAKDRLGISLKEQWSGKAKVVIEEPIDLNNLFKKG